MKKYGVEMYLSFAWKKAHASGWAQYHPKEKCWKRHYIENGTEYSTGDFLTKAEAEREVKFYRG